mgnify:CR=1 FL=1
MADQKPSNRERVKEIVASIEQNIQDLFQSERYFDYLRTMSRFHSYSVNNTILIHMQRPHASMPAAGFNKWKQFGRHVKKGEKGLTIIAPTPLKKKIEEMRLDPDTKAPVRDRDGNIIMDEKTVEIPLFKPVKVFTADQTEGKPLPSLATGLTGDVQQYEAFMEALRRTSPMPISFVSLAPDTDGVCSFTKQTISIREGMSQVQTVCATVHEIGHAVLHDREKDRLSAAAGNTDKDPPKAKDKNTMEVEAESVSFAVCQYYGIDTSANSMGYIAGWSRDKSLPELKASLETITKTVSGLINTIDRHFAEICKERGIDLTAQPEQAGPDTLEQFAADLYDYMDQLHQTGILERPFTLDPREQSIADLVTEMQTGYFDGVRGPLTYLVEHNSLMTAKAMLERLDGLVQERTAPAAELTDTPEKFVSDLCGYLAELQEARLIPLPNNAELREKENMAEALLPSMLNGSFNGFRSILNDAAQHTERPETAVLRDRLEKLSDQWDAALVYKIEPIFGAGSTVDRSAVQTYRKQNDQLTPYKLVFTGTAAECQRVVAGLEAGTFTLRDMRQPDFEPPSPPGQRYVYKMDVNPRMVNADDYRYVTEGTFDAYLWQTVENKQKFISQIMTSKSPARTCEDVDEAALSYAEIKALCAGDPRIKERMELDVDVSKLKIMKSAHQSQQFQMEDNLLKYFPEQIAQHQGFIKGLEDDMKTLAEHPHPLVVKEKPKPAKVEQAETAEDTSVPPAQAETASLEGPASTEVSQGFAGMVVQGETFTDKEEAGKALLSAYMAGNVAEMVEIGSYRGFTMFTEVRNFQRELVLKGTMTHRTTLGMDPIGALVRIDHTLDKMPERLEAVRTQLENLFDQREAAKAEVGKPFPREDELKEKSARLAELDVLLNIDGSHSQGEQAIAKSARPSVLDSLKRPHPPRGKAPDKPKRPQQER